MNSKDQEKLRSLQTDLEHLAGGDWQAVPSIEDLAKTALVTLSAQKRILDGLRHVLFQEAAWLLKERMDEGIDERCEERLRLCAIRLSEGARVTLESYTEQEERLLQLKYSQVPVQHHPKPLPGDEGDGETESLES